MKSSAIVKGHHLGVGGKREGAGRKPDKYKQRALFLLAKYNLLERLAKIAAGENVDVHHTITGQAFPCPAPIAAQVNACRELLDRGLGKPVQAIAGENGGPLTVNVIDYKNAINNTAA